MDVIKFRIGRSLCDQETDMAEMGGPSLYPRFSADRIKTALKDTPVVLLIGPRQAGKSTLVQQFSRGDDRTYLTLDDQNVLLSAQRDPEGLLSSRQRLTIDEIQRAPDLLLTIKKSVDQDRRPGRFLLTGSADILTLPTVSESLAGRMEIISLLPLSHAEIAAAPPSFLKLAFEGRLPEISTGDGGTSIRESVLTGGYPEILTRTDPERRMRWAKSYLDALFSRDVGEISGIEKHETLSRLFRLVVSRSGQIPNFTQWGGTLGLNDKTTKRYVFLLEQLFLVHRLEPWQTNLSSRILKSPKIYALDSGLQSLVTGLTREKLDRDRSLYGSLLETFVVSEIKKQSEWYSESLFLSHYRDKEHNEVDLLCEDRSGRIVAIEIKASMTVTPADLRGIKKLREILGERLVLALVLHEGTRTLPLGDNIFTAPVSILWGKGV